MPQPLRVLRLTAVGQDRLDGARRNARARVPRTFAACGRLDRALFAAAPSLVRAGRRRAAAAGFKDTICPEGTQYVLEVGKLRTDDRPSASTRPRTRRRKPTRRARRRSRPTAFARRSTTADVRSAQFGVVAARALIAMGRYDEARAELQRDRASGPERRRLDRRNRSVQQRRRERFRGDRRRRPAPVHVSRVGARDRRVRRPSARRDRAPRRGAAPPRHGARRPRRRHTPRP